MFLAGRWKRIPGFAEVNNTRGFSMKQQSVKLLPSVYSETFRRLAVRSSFTPFLFKGNSISAAVKKLSQGFDSRRTTDWIPRRLDVKSRPVCDEAKGRTLCTRGSGHLSDFQGLFPGGNLASNDTRFVCPVVLRCPSPFLARGRKK